MDEILKSHSESTGMNIDSKLRVIDIANLVKIWGLFPLFRGRSGIKDSARGEI